MDPCSERTRERERERETNSSVAKLYPTRARPRSFAALCECRDCSSGGSEFPVPFLSERKRKRYRRVAGLLAREGKSCARGAGMKSSADIRRAVA